MLCVDGAHSGSTGSRDEAKQERSNSAVVSEEVLTKCLVNHMHQQKALQNRQLRLLLQHMADMKTPVTWSNADHTNLLERLWAGWSPDVPFPGQQSELWKNIGFQVCSSLWGLRINYECCLNQIDNQGNDPTTDFRGMGVFALQVGGHAHQILSNVAYDSTCACGSVWCT